MRPGPLARLAAVGLLLTACAGPPPAAPGPGVPQAACEAPVGSRFTVVGSGQPGDPALPEPSSGYRLGMAAVSARHAMVVTAHPLATLAGCRVLRAGGSAADAAVAVQAVLGLVEPQSSGLGGGAFALYYDAATRSVQTYDGRETAPAAAREDDLRWRSADDRQPPLPDARASGRSIGTPGTVKLLALLHQDHGRLAWPGLFDAGIRLAREGFPIGGRLSDAIAAARDALRRDPDAAAYFLNPDLTPRRLGTGLRNPAYADTLASIARDGAAAFYGGDIAQAIVDEIQRELGGPAAPVAITPGRTTLADLAQYQALRRPPVCTDYRRWRVCGMGPPSSGGIAVAQTLGMLAQFDLAALAPTGVDPDGGTPRVAALHLISEAERLAFADRNKYVADTAYVPLPARGVASMLDPAYLRARAALIHADRSMGVAAAGRFPGAPVLGRSANEGKGTSQVSIVDAQGNALSMTTTIESSLGAFRLVRGFLLNNELTDFSFEPADDEGPIANRVQPGKRPRSSMAPTLVFRRTADGSLGELVMVTGSPGGASIIPYVVKTLVGVLDWGLDAQQSAALVNVGAGNTPVTFVGGEHPHAAALADGLRALGHRVSLDAQSSGVATVLRRPQLAEPLQGGADPRREGLALGD